MLITSGSQRVRRKRERERERERLKENIIHTGRSHLCEFRTKENLKPMVSHKESFYLTEKECFGKRYVHTFIY